MGYDLQEQSRQGNNLDKVYTLSDYEYITIKCKEVVFVNLQTITFIFLGC